MSDNNTAIQSCRYFWYNNLAETYAGGTLELQKHYADLVLSGFERDIYRFADYSEQEIKQYILAALETLRVRIGEKVDKISDPELLKSQIINENLVNEILSEPDDTSGLAFFNRIYSIFLVVLAIGFFGFYGYTRYQRSVLFDSKKQELRANTPECDYGDTPTVEQYFNCKNRIKDKFDKLYD